MLAVSLLVVSCSKEEVLTTSQPEGFAHICVGVNDFTITEGEFPTRDGEPVIEYAGVKAIDLAFYEGTTEVYKHTQMRDENPHHLRCRWQEFQSNHGFGHGQQWVCGHQHA